MAPFPEEANRRVLGIVANLHLAPTRRAVDRLWSEGVARDRVILVGNTVVDAVLRIAGSPYTESDLRLAGVQDLVASGTARLVLVTAHRRESWGAPMDRILAAVEQVVDERPDLWCVLPAHPNPAVRHQVHERLAEHPRVVITDPLGYPALCHLLASASLVLSDSGGIQEEAPSFRVPVLVLREVTERTEAVEAGWARLVGTDTAQIVSAAKEILDGDFVAPLSGNPFGDGHSARRSADAIEWMLGLASRPAPFAPNR